MAEESLSRADGRALAALGHTACVAGVVLQPSMSATTTPADSQFHLRQGTSPVAVPIPLALTPLPLAASNNR